MSSMDPFSLGQSLADGNMLSPLNPANFAEDYRFLLFDNDELLLMVTSLGSTKLGRCAAHELARREQVKRQRATEEDLTIRIFAGSK